MRFAGQLVKSGKWYAAEVPVLGIDTQGKSKANGYAMVKDAIESLVNNELKRAFYGQATVAEAIATMTARTAELFKV